MPPTKTPVSTGGVRLNAPLCGCQEHLDKQIYCSVLPLPIDQAIDINFGPECPVFWAFFKAAKYKEPHIPPWSDTLKQGSVRSCRYRVTAANPLVKAVDIIDYDTWTVLRHVPGVSCTIEKVASTPEVMYGDTFNVVLRYCFTSVPAPSPSTANPPSPPPSSPPPPASSSSLQLAPPPPSPLARPVPAMQAGRLHRHQVAQEHPLKADHQGVGDAAVGGALQADL